MSRPSGALIALAATALLASLGLSLLVGWAMVPAAEPTADVPATQAAVKHCLTTRLDVPLRLPETVPPARVARVAPRAVPQMTLDAGGNPVPAHCAPTCTGWTDFATGTILVSNWTPLPHELVHYLLDEAGLEWTLNADHRHPGFDACGHPGLIVWA